MYMYINNNFGGLLWLKMSLKELFEIGQSFESSVGEGTKG